MPIILLNDAERLRYIQEDVTIYYHRLLYSERAEVSHLATERGRTDMQFWLLETAKRAVEGWSGIYDVDMHEIPVPPADNKAERRAKIAAIVEYFPFEVIQGVATLALTDTPEELKKSWERVYLANSASPTDAPDGSSPAPTADGSAAKTD